MPKNRDDARKNNKAGIIDLFAYPLFLKSVVKGIENQMNENIISNTGKSQIPLKNDRKPKNNKENMDKT